MDHSSETRPLVVLRGRLSKNQLIGLNALCHLLYTPRELANAIGITRRQIYRVYIPLGCPHTKDQTGHIWINGLAFKEWYKAKYSKRTLQPDETFCLTCKSAVPIVNPQTVEKSGMVFIQSTCPQCGRILARFTENHWNNNTTKKQSNE